MMKYIYGDCVEIMTEMLRVEEWGLALRGLGRPLTKKSCWKFFCESKYHFLKATFQIQVCIRNSALPPCENGLQVLKMEFVCDIMELTNNVCTGVKLWVRAFA